MVKKENNDNDNTSSDNSEEKTNNLQHGLTLNNIDDDNFKEEAFAIYEAINEGKLDLTPEEKNEILQELDLIINHFESLPNYKSNENLDNVSDLSVDDALDDVGDVSFKKSLGGEVSSVDFASVESSSDDSVEVVVADDESVVSVDDALDDLVDNYSDEIAIKVDNISMEFKVSKDKIDTLKEFVIRTIKRNKSGTKIVKALDDVSFEIPKGDRVGIIGFNGAGKSTLLKILAGVYDATEGTIETKGKIAPLLELGAGFDPNYTGKNNIFLNGAFLGYSEDFLKEKYDEILEFSELGDAINYHVKTYSSGMRTKLGFSIATMVEPDILILDEILSVGDIKFRRKSADKIRSLINSGITVLLVSHSVAQIRDLCNKAIWIDEGKLKMYGEVNKVCDAYSKAASKASREQLKNIQLD